MELLSFIKGVGSIKYDGGYFQHFWENIYIALDLVSTHLK